MKRIVLLTLLCFIATTNFTYAQYVNVDFEPGGLGASWNWIMDSNDDNPPLEFIANPVSGGINTTANVAKFTARLNGNPWALTYTDDLEEFQFDATNTTVKIMVYKPTISNVGMKFEGQGGNIELLVANTVINQWEELTFDFSGQIGNTYNRMVVIPDFDFARMQENIVYFDNIQIPEGNILPPAEPTVGAPIPVHNEVTNNVISIFSDSYTNVAGTNLNPFWGQQTVVTEENIAGNNTLKYANLNYQGTAFGSNQNVSGHDFLHVDFWTADATTLQFFLISPPPNGEVPFTLTITPNQWNSVEIPLSAFPAPVNLADVFQFKVVGNGTVYFDNYYFYEQVGMPAAPTPIHNEVADNVISIYSDSYTNVAGTNLNPFWGQQTVVTEEVIAGNNTLKYSNLNYQGTQFGSNQDVSGHDYLHVDFYTTDATFIDFYLISPPPNGEVAYSFNVIPNQWNSVEIPLSAFPAPVNLSDVFQFKVVGNGTVYFDNYYFYEGMTAAPDPIHDEVTNNVISIYSDSYTNVPGTNLNPFWGQQTIVTEENIAGNNTLKYTNLNYQGTQFGSNQDVSGHDFLHVDFYTEDASFLDFYLISPPPNGEVAYSMTVVPNQWNSVEIPLSAFPAPVNLSDVFQFKVVGNGTVYFDNFYFYEEDTPTVSIELCVDLDCQGSATAPSVFGSFNGGCANCDPVLDPDGDGVYCAILDLEPGVYEYRFFTQETGPEVYAAPGACTNAAGTSRVITVVAGTPQSVTFAWETCEEECIPIPTVDMELCVDLSCLPGVQAPSVFGAFNGWNAGANPVTDPDGDGIYCATVNMQIGDQPYKFFDQLQGPENFTSVTNGCTGLNGPFIDRIVTVVENNPQSLTFAWNSCDPTCPKPTTGAPTPIHDESDNCVISIFSDSYTNVTGTDLNPFWGQQTTTTVKDINGNNTLQYFNLNYQGTQFGSNQNVSDHDFVHLDFWTANATFIDFYLISPGNEIAYPLTIVSDQWVSVDIPLSAFVPPVNLNNVFQFKVVGNGTVYFDNYYFWQETTTWYADADGDGFGDPNVTVETCTQPSGFVLDNTDCDDNAPNTFPGAVDIPCNGIDEDCDGEDYIPTEAVVSLPTLPESISCEVAETFSAAAGTYDNGESGIYNISGTMPAQVFNFWDKCGGIIVVNYADVIDICGRTIEGGNYTIEVQAAPIPTIIIPTLPSNLSCGDAQNYTPPGTTANNGLTGSCGITGQVEVEVNNFYDACGGTMEVIYYGMDECERNMIAMVGYIDVDPAPAPIITVPTYPSQVTCSEAENFVGIVAEYSNGETGDCEISGLIESTIEKNIDACSGGTITISYNGQDDCGNSISANSVVISVLPADPAVLEGPANLPNTIYCWEAFGWVAPNATFENGSDGACQNSGEIEPEVIEYWNSCDGGYIIMTYEGFDNCGNELVPMVLKVTVKPDVWAPTGECAPVDETVPSISAIPGGDDLGYYLNMIANGYDENCGDVFVDVIDDTGSPQCDELGNFERVYTVEVTDKCGNVAGTCTITFSGSCDQNFCTLTQKFYGNPVDELFGTSSAELVKTLLDDGNNPIVVGDGDCGIVVSDAQCVQSLMNSYGPSVSVSSGSGSCDGTNNSLVNQIITTTLNIRYNEMMNPNGPLDLGGLLLGTTCMNIPGYILNELPANPNVNDLIKYANDFIACQCTSTCDAFEDNMADLTNLFWGLNSRFNLCHVPAPCVDGQPGYNDPNFGGTITQNQNASITLYPNPINNIINLEVNEYFGIPAVIEIFDTRGAKIGEKSFLPIDQNTLQFDATNFESGLYWLSIKVEGQDLITKKFIVSK